MYCLDKKFDAQKKNGSKCFGDVFFAHWRVSRVSWRKCDEQSTNFKLSKIKSKRYKTAYLHLQRITSSPKRGLVMVARQLERFFLVALLCLVATLSVTFNLIGTAPCGIKTELIRPIDATTMRHSPPAAKRYTTWQQVVDHMRPVIEQSKKDTVRQLQEGVRANTCPDSKSQSCPFVDVQPFVSIGPPFVRQGFVDPKYLGRDCLLYAYGVGSNRDSAFVNTIELYCDVHAFDCTIASGYYPVLRDRAFEFHSWCIGGETNIGDTMKVQQDGHVLQFKSLEGTLNELNHTRMDYLTLDVAGSEWELFDAILSLPKERLPWSLVFELNTDGASQKAVQLESAKNKHRKQVNEAMLRFIEGIV
jgi:hypothetical protein